MISDDPAGKIIKCQIIKSGQSMFDSYLTDVVTKKNEKRRKSKEKNFDTKSDYSIANLIKIERKKLPGNQILAQQLMKTNFRQNTEEEEMAETYKYYEDFEAAQKFNKKVLKRFIKPAKKHYLQNIGEGKSKNPLEMFKDCSESLIQNQAEHQLDKLDQRNRIKTKLETTRQMLEQMDQKMLYFASNIQVHFRQLQKEQERAKSRSDLIQNMCDSFKQIFLEEGISNTTYSYEKSLQKFTCFIEQSLPSYLRLSQYQSYSPLPWKTNHIQKQLARTSYQQITGKFLYKFEHNMVQLKEKKLKLRIHEVQKEGFDQIKKYLEEEQKKNSELKNQGNKIQGKQNRNILVQQDSKAQTNTSWKCLLPTTNREIEYQKQFKEEKINYDKKSYEIQSKQKNYLCENLISNNIDIQKRRADHAPLKYFEPFNQNQNQSPLTNHPSDGYNSNSVDRFIAIKTKVPPSAQIYNSQSPNLDQYKFSKHDQFIQNQAKLQQKNKIKSKGTPRNIMFNKEIHSPPQKRVTETRHSKKILPVQIYRPQHYSDSQNQSSSSSQESDFFNTMTQYKQKKTTKKKKSFLKMTPPQSNSHGQIKIKQSRNVVLTKKGVHIDFYPLKLGNLVLERKNYSYIEYNSAKEDLKNLTIKFLIDRIKHGVNNVEIVVPSLGYRNPNTMKVNDQQKAKQIVKIILQLGGHVQKIKHQSGYQQQTSGHEKSHRPKISAEIQIYKFFYKDLTYFEIIDALNLERQWLQSEKDNQKLGGWKY